MSYFFIVLNFIKGNGRNILIGVLCLAVVVMYFYAGSQFDRANRLEVKQAYAERQLESQSESIKQLSSLQKRIDEQISYREKVKKNFSEQTDRILGELNDLKEGNKLYAKCSSVELPYTLDGLFTEGSAGLQDNSTNSSE